MVVEARNKGIFVSFLPSYSNSFAAFTDWEEATELNGEKKKENNDSDI